ncbi:YheE family protein [Robertmurraya kyonggiensis]|uniref:YheE family protein n=1 Tax=Robertmurraya kyonggiensis TaxID=1037680 RepID=A0A4U1D9M0_9BACI|nr:YheE family protein [Robertmurraya kyonggiensis]TKC18126.1 hypothetical protein FA727_00785 [Robertmurraya kyonggiensis]
MITHFQYKPLYENKEMPGWHFSFYYQKQKYNGIYFSDGKIEWASDEVPNDEESIIKQIHEIMLFHVYDK